MVHGIMQVFQILTCFIRHSDFYLSIYWSLMGLPLRLSGEESPCQCRTHGFDPWVRKIPWRRKWQPTPVLLPGESYGPRNLQFMRSQRVAQGLATKQQHTSLSHCYHHCESHQKPLIIGKPLYSM